ncbi:MAG: hypothetical protein LBP33_12070, partial [Candidatus Adiutrix sp.]|nr:hypothetical protein [Candidatus Adiutrix sp.]
MASPAVGRQKEAPSHKKPTSLMKSPCRKKTWSTWVDLELEFDIALFQTDELRRYFLNQLLSE